MSLFCFGERSIDIEDQGARLNDQGPYVIQRHVRQTFRSFFIHR